MLLGSPELESPSSLEVLLGLVDRETQHTSGVGMSECAAVAGTGRYTTQTDIIESVGLNGDLAIGRESKSCQVADFDFPGASASTHTSQDANYSIVAEGAKDVKYAIRGCCGAKSCTGHALSVVLVHLPGAVWLVRRDSIRTVDKFGQKVVQFTLGQPVGTKSRCIVSFKASNVPSISSILALITCI